jgi:hypothetical protein
MTRLYGDEAELYDIGFDWDLGEEADWLVAKLGATRRTFDGAVCPIGTLMHLTPDELVRV